MTGTPSAAAAHIVEWLVERALASSTASEVFEGLIKRLRDEGFMIDRGHLAYTTLHPLHHGSGVTWSVDKGLVTEAYEHRRETESLGWAVSPMRYVVNERVDRLRRRLAGPGATLDFPVLEQFAAAGLTDYLLLACEFDSFFAPVADEEDDAKASTSGMACSFATAREGGFSDYEVETLHWLLQPLALVIKMADQRQVALNLAECYIGREAGPRVLGGAIQRGDFSSTPAVVWLSDLRASTEMSITMASDEFIATLNEFFDCTAGAVEEEGGEPLTFIGDGALAIFPIERMGERGARMAAVAAAERATRALEALNRKRAADGRRELDWGIALHAGVMEYGNIGSLARHSWSVIGAAVNETARLEGTTKLTGEPIVASRAFVEKLDADWRPMGSFDLQGVPGAFEVFAPPLAAKSRTKEFVA